MLHVAAQPLKGHKRSLHIPGINVNKTSSKPHPAQHVGKTCYVMAMVAHVQELFERLFAEVSLSFFVAI